MFHTVYNSFEPGPDGRDYIGKHSTEDPYDDYLGSFKDRSFNPDDKIVFAYAKTKEGAVWLEIMFQRVFGVVEDPQFANQAYQTSDKFVAGFKGENNPMFGASRPDVTKRNLIDNPAKKPDAVAKLSAFRKGRPRSQSTKDKISCTKTGSESAKLGGRVASSQKWRCTVTGFVSTPCGLTHYQRARNIPTTCRERVG